MSHNLLRHTASLTCRCSIAGKEKCISTIFNCPLTVQDHALIEKAQKTIHSNYDEKDQNHTVGSAILCESGNIYVGVNDRKPGKIKAKYLLSFAYNTENQKQLYDINTFSHQYRRNRHHHYTGDRTKYH